MGEVRFNRPSGDEDLRTELGRRRRLVQEFEHLDLARRQRGQPFLGEDGEPGQLARSSRLRWVLSSTARMS